MTQNKFDLTIDTSGVNVGARIKRDAENSYRERWVRTEVTQNVLDPVSGRGAASRPDVAKFYQSNWKDGARWWKPLVEADEQHTYFQSNHMDLWSEPGKIVPTNQVVDIASTSINDNCVIGVGAAGAVYAIGATAVDVTSQLDVYLWTPASNLFVRESNYNSGVALAANPMAMVYDPSDQYFYIISDDDDIERFNPTTAAENADYITSGFTSYLGANIFLQSGNLMFYSGDRLYTINKSTTSVTEVFNDGMGKDFLSDISFAGSAPLFRENLRLAISTPEGIYYVKNTRQGGQPVAWVFRVDLDEAGNWIGNPIATLPTGSVALSIISHLGSIIVSTSPNWRGAVVNDTNEVEIVLYHVTQGSLGALGSILGGRQALDETPYALLGSDGAQLFIGGHKRLWVYDAINGGLHTAFTWGTELANGAYVAMAFVLDSGSVSSNIFLGRDRLARVKTEQNTDPDLVTSFGDDETHYTLESNYFDLGFPMESKDLTKVSVLVDAASTASAQEWTVQISTDDGAFADVITHSGTAQKAESSITAGTHRGTLFRAKLIYQTKLAMKRAFRALLITGSTGEQVREWDLILEGESMKNVGNAPFRPSTFVSSMRTVAAKEENIVVAFAYQDKETATSINETVTVKVQSVEILKSSADEGAIHFVIREV